MMKPVLYRIAPAEYLTTRWGGGATTQIAIAPAGAVYADREFLWRVSSATVELEASDFTPLPDYDRFLSTVEGGIRVYHDGGEAVPLSPGSIHRFDGGAATRSEGTCRDFNLMLRKGTCTGELRCVHLAEGGTLRLTATLAPTDGKTTFVVYCTEGDGALNAAEETVPFAKGEAVQVESGEALLRSGGASTFFLCEIAAL